MHVKPVSAAHINGDLIAGMAFARSLLLLPIGYLTWRMWQSANRSATPDTEI